MNHSIFIAALCVFAATTTSASVTRTERPIARPAEFQVAHLAVPNSFSGAQMTRPAPRPAFTIHNAMSKPQPPKSGKNGGICGSRDIIGHSIGRIKPALNGCGVEDAVEIVSVSGVALSTPSRMDCTTAQALNSWVAKGAVPAVGRTGGGLRSLRVVAHYACRTRNNQAGAKISEHGRGRAIDIAGFTLNDGTNVSVLKGWNERDAGKILRKMHTSACGPFGTVLGPESNRFHRDHFHFDTASYRSGSYCR